MSDRLALTEAIEAGGIERAKASRIASVIFDAIHQNVATKADVQANEASLRAEMAGLRSEMHGGFARHDVAIERLRSSLRELESRLLLRLGSLMMVLTGVILAALRYWPPH